MIVVHSNRNVERRERKRCLQRTNDNLSEGVLKMAWSAIDNDDGLDNVESENDDIVYRQVHLGVSIPAG